MTSTPSEEDQRVLGGLFHQQLLEESATRREDDLVTRYSWAIPRHQGHIWELFLPHKILKPLCRCSCEVTPVDLIVAFFSHCTRNYLFDWMRGGPVSANTKMRIFFKSNSFCGFLDNLSHATALHWASWMQFTQDENVCLLTDSYNTMLTHSYNSMLTHSYNTTL